MEAIFQDGVYVPIFFYENLCTNGAFGYLSMKLDIHTKQEM